MEVRIRVNAPDTEKQCSIRSTEKSSLYLSYSTLVTWTRWANIHGKQEWTKTGPQFMQKWKDKKRKIMVIIREIWRDMDTLAIVLLSLDVVTCINKGSYLLCWLLFLRWINTAQPSAPSCLHKMHGVRGQLGFELSIIVLLSPSFLKTSPVQKKKDIY